MTEEQMQEPMQELDVPDLVEPSEELLEEQPTEEPEQPSAQERELEQLRARVCELEEQVKERDHLSLRVQRECAEFEQYFPDVSLRQVPDDVWQSVHAGVPLAAAYALYERQREQKAQAYHSRNESSAARLGELPGQARQELFSPAQVRAMSQSEVRENYDRIFESMRHWQ